MKAGWVSGAGAACRRPYMWRCEMGERIEKKVGKRFGKGVEDVLYLQERYHVFAMGVMRKLGTIIAAVVIFTGSLAWGNVTGVQGRSVAWDAVADSVSEAVVWDFSDAETTGRARLRYVAVGDSMVMEFLPSVRCDFRIHGDSLFLERLEGRTWRAETGGCPIRPGSVDAGHYHLSRDLAERWIMDGVTASSVADGQTAILQPGDTIRDARLFQITFSGTMHAAGDDYGTIDSTGQAVRVTRRYWFAPESDYPVAVGQEVACGAADMAGTYLFPLDGHPQSDGPARRNAPAMATIGALARMAEGKAGDLAGGGMSRRSATTTTGASKSQLWDGKEPEVRVDGQAVAVNAFAETGQVDILLCDVAGRVLDSRRGVTSPVVFGDLRPGEYVVAVECGNRHFAEKISIR